MKRLITILAVCMQACLAEANTNLARIVNNIYGSNDVNGIGHLINTNDFKHTGIGSNEVPNAGWVSDNFGGGGGGGGVTAAQLENARTNSIATNDVGDVSGSFVTNNFFTLSQGLSL